jgi:hypothetical protein
MIGNPVRTVTYTRVCVTCRCEKPLSKFRRRSDRDKVAYRSSCRKCESDYGRRYYAQHRHPSVVPRPRTGRGTNKKWTDLARVLQKHGLLKDAS